MFAFYIILIYKENFLISIFFFSFKKRYAMKICVVPDANAIRRFYIFMKMRHEFVRALTGLLFMLIEKAT